MIRSDRVRELLEVRGLSQSELARRVRVTQGAIAKLVSKNPGGSSHIHKIARELGTTPAYLEGETDDPDEDAPLPAPEPMYQFVSMPMAFPNEDALAAMFEGLLLPLDLSQPLDALARTLAKRLPIGLAQLRDLLPRTSSAAGAAPGRAAPPPARDRREPPRAPRT